jgi:hypothetical protein
MAYRILFGRSDWTRLEATEWIMELGCGLSRLAEGRVQRSAVVWLKRVPCRTVIYLRMGLSAVQSSGSGQGSAQYSRLVQERIQCSAVLYLSIGFNTVQSTGSG